MTMTNHNRPSYNTVPHYIAREYRSGELSISQLRVLLWLRAIGTPYGIATTSLVDLKNDVFPDLDWKINTINSMLLKLRQKQHIFYEPRQGKSGTFEIQLNHWFMPKGYKTLDKFFPEPKQWIGADGEPIAEGYYPQANPSEANQKSVEQNQKLTEQREQLIKRFSLNSDSRQIRSSHNDTENEIKNEIEKSSTPVRGKQLRNKRPTHSFTPKNDAEERCRDIAREVGDEYVDFILSALYHKNGGIKVIEEAFLHFQDVLRIAEEKGDVEPIENPPAFFNTCIQSAIYDNEEKKSGKW